jgi:hypothetical protein
MVNRDRLVAHLVRDKGGRRFKSCHSEQLSRRSDHIRGQLCGTKRTGDNLAPPIHADPAAFIGAAGVDSLPAFWRRGARADEAAAAQEIGGH